MREGISRLHCSQLLALLMFANAAPAETPNARTIYRCIADNVTTFSDKPCQTGAQPYKFDEARVSRYTPLESSAQSKESSSHGTNKKRQKAALAAAESSVKECKKIHDALRVIAGNMRSGYTVAQGERLKQRKAQLDARRRDIRCR